VSARITWAFDCDKPYYSQGFTNVLYFEDFTYNRVNPETERVLDENDEVINIKTLNYFSFSRLVPDYLISAFKVMEEPGAVIKLEDAEINTSIYVHDVRVEVSDPITNNHHLVTVRFRHRNYDPGLIPSMLYHYGEIDSVKPCETIDFIDEDLTGPGSGSGSCPGFGITVNESGGNLSYTIANEPVYGNLLIQWFLNGAPISTGATVALGSFGTYKVQAVKDGCVVSDTYAYLSPCASMVLDVVVNLGVISGNVTGAPGAVTYEVYDENSLLVASALPYTALVDGVYTVVATSDDCEISKQVIIDIDAGCSHTAVITKIGATLTGSSDAASPSYEWFLDTGTGPVSISTVAAITINKNGLYILKVTQDGCTTSSQLVITDYELNVNVNNPSVVIMVHGDTGHVYPVTWITGECIVKRNGVTLQPVTGSPGPGEYKMNLKSFELASYLPLNLGEIVTIESQ
jgi:hypothetical protein